jgi:hypothetical protein
VRAAEKMSIGHRGPRGARRACTLHTFFEHHPRTWRWWCSVLTVQNSLRERRRPRSYPGTSNPARSHNRRA